MIKDYLKLFRIPQWIKNLFVFVPLLFSKNLFEQNYFITVFLGFIAFSLTSSIVYIINDIADVEADKQHPIKKLRPLPSGKLSRNKAIISAFFLAVLVVLLLLNFNYKFSLAIISYFVLNVFYSSILKNIVLLDIFSIATGFMLRILAGAFIINVFVSSWLILTTMFISLFLAIMKRQSEIRLNHEIGGHTSRKVLSSYSLEFTNQMATVAASGVIICYALYTVANRTVSIFGTERLIYTTPFVVFGIFRYMYLVYINKKGENTTEIMITDLQMIINVILYVITTTLIIYKII